MPASDLTWAIDDVKARADRYRLAREYDEGNHRLLFATEKFRNSFGDLFQEFADNFCDDVLDSITDRVQILGWSAEDKALATTVDDLWTKTRGEAVTSDTFRNGYREGDGFTIVAQKPDGTVKRYRQKNPGLIAIRYDDDDEKAVVAKVWKVPGTRRWRINLMYPDHLERYGSAGSSAQGALPKASAFSLLAENDPLLGQGEKAEEAWDAIPVFHYPNGPLGEYGRSLLTGVIPLQDAFNKSVADMLVAMEEVALPGRYAIGVQGKIDPETGREVEPFTKRSPGSMYRVGGKRSEVEFGQFQAASMDGFLNVQDSLKIEIARKGLLPPSAITLRSWTTTASVSGVALLVAEGRTIKAARRKHRDWGSEARAEMAYMASLKMAADVQPEDVEPQWVPPETRDMKALLEEVTMKRDLGVPLETCLVELGYDADDARQWAADLEDAISDQGRQEAEAARTALGSVAGGLGIPSAPPAPEGAGTTPLAS